MKANVVLGITLNYYLVLAGVQVDLVFLQHFERLVLLSPEARCRRPGDDCRLASMASRLGSRS
jgi:hypothetical protein